MGAGGEGREHAAEYHARMDACQNGLAGGTRTREELVSGVREPRQRWVCTGGLGDMDPWVWLRVPARQAAGAPGVGERGYFHRTTAHARWWGLTRGPMADQWR